MFGMFGEFTAQPGRRDELAQALRQAAQTLQGAQGALAYLVYLLPDDPDAVGVFEVWKSREDHKASLQLPAVQELITRARPLLSGAPRSREIEPLGGLGLVPEV